MPTVELGPEWGIDAAAALKAALDPHLEHADDVVLAAPDAGRVHSATVQLLASFVRTRRAAGRATRLHPCADALRAAVAQLGLSADIGLTNPHR